MDKEKEVDRTCDKRRQSAKESYRGKNAGPKPPRGRKRFGMLSDLKGKESYVQLKRRADNRDQWRTWGPGEDEGDDEEDDES